MLNPLKSFHARLNGSSPVACCGQSEQTSQARGGVTGSETVTVVLGLCIAVIVAVASASVLGPTLVRPVLNRMVGFT